MTSHSTPILSMPASSVSPSISPSSSSAGSVGSKRQQLKDNARRSRVLPKKKSNPIRQVIRKNEERISQLERDVALLKYEMSAEKRPSWFGDPF